MLVDSLISEYGGNLFNISGIEKGVTVNIADVRDGHSMRPALRGKDRAVEQVIDAVTGSATPAR